MFAAAKILELLAVTGEKLGPVGRELPRLSMVEREVPCPWEMKGKIMRHFMKESEGLECDFVDGIKVYLNSAGGISSVLIKPDKERALFHIRAEAIDKSSASNLAQMYEQKIQQWKDGGKAP
jgi:mannose-1-phosphate guanylyltransferase/phosphomannomutase